MTDSHKTYEDSDKIEMKPIFYPDMIAFLPFLPNLFAAFFELDGLRRNGASRMGRRP